MPDLISAPRHDEVEFSAFGPGYGECLLVHLGEGEWMIVDSCVQREHVPVLSYLRAMGVNPATDVKLVVATHWHDDHVRGMAEILTACSTAGFACSAALGTDEFLQGIGRLDVGLGGRLTSGVREMRTVLEMIANSAGQRPEAQWAIQNRRLHRRSGTVHCEVAALAPSDRVMTHAYQDVAHLVGQGGSRRVPKPDRNLGAVVLRVEVGDAAMLLGSDLQESPGAGWTAVLGCGTGIDRPCEIFKVPHHGSSNAHHDGVWNEMLVERPEAVVCPHCKGGNSLPKPDDLERLCRLSNVHLTAPQKCSPKVLKGRPMLQAVPEFGRVTLRRLLGTGNAWTVSYAGPAEPGCAQEPDGQALD